MKKRQPPRIVFRWDLDKTYLDTDFDSLRALVRAPFERAQDKVDMPGVVALVKALRRSAEQRGQKASVFFLTASPPQMSKAIRKKLALDGVEVDGIVFKDQLKQIVKGRFRYLREQVGFKLAELLKARIALGADSIEILFGDDWESDPIAYSLYADFLAGRLSINQLRQVLKRLRVDPARAREIERVAPRVPVAEAVVRIFIHLKRRTPPKTFRPYGPRLVAAFDYFQTAAVLTQDGYCDFSGLCEVAEAMVQRGGYNSESLAGSLADLKHRRLLSARWYHAELGELAERGLVRLVEGAWKARWCRRMVGVFRLGRKLGRRAVVTAGARAGAARSPTDYLEVIDSWSQAGRHRDRN